MEYAKPADISAADVERLDKLQESLISSSGKNVVLVAYEKEQ